MHGWMDAGIDKSIGFSKSNEEFQDMKWGRM
jgi:hypothetical protein